jgi:ADP-heptose:LPS heptosyltransferase
MRGRYFVRSRAGLVYLRALDAALSTFRSRRVTEAIVPDRLLVGVGGHLGDAVVATSAIAALRRAFPDCRIGVAAPSWVAPVLEGHPAIETIHRIDHWKLNRSAINRYEKLRATISTYHTALSEIRSCRYDASIDLYPFYPNMSLLFAHAGIPVRIGYDSGGGGPVQTRPTPWVNDSRHIATKQLQLVGLLTGKAEGDPRYDLPLLTESDEAFASAIRARAGLRSGYVVLHPGTGNPLKSWPAENWMELARTLVLDGRQVAITGHGAEEVRLAAWLRSGEPRLVDLSGQTTLRQLRVVLRDADLFIGCDSVASHLAAASATPAVTIMAGMNDSRAWTPLSDASIAISHFVTCAPCFRDEGCSLMSCIRDISVDDVMEAGRRAARKARKV